MEAAQPRVQTRRGTTNRNVRGSSEARRRRKQWLLDTFGDGSSVDCHGADCSEVLTLETLTVDRYPVPGVDGGTYRRGNIRPLCGFCNSAAGGRLAHARRLSAVPA